MNTFLPPNYERPATGGGNYAKLEDGANRFRILTNAIVGFLYWTRDNKPVRLRTYPAAPPEDMREGDKIKHFWAFVVWNYRDAKIQVLEITQATIQGPLEDLVTSEDWGDPKEYDITITKKGQKLDTEYTVMPSKPSAVPIEAGRAYRALRIDLEKLFDGGDPFGGEREATPEITQEDTPFPPRF